MPCKKRKNPQKEGKERELRFDKWAESKWPHYRTAGMKWNKPHAGYPDRMLYDDNEIICVEVKGAGHEFHSWQLERMQLLERMGAKVYIATEKDDDPSDFQLHSIHDLKRKREKSTKNR